MDKVHEWLEKNKYVVGLGICAIAVGSLVYSWRKPEQKPLASPRLQHIPHMEIRNSENTTFFTDQVFDKQAELNRVVMLIEVSSHGLLSFDEVRAIYVYSLEVIRDEYARFTREVRKRRRLIRKLNEQQYLNILLDYDDKINELLERGRLDLVEALEIDPERYEESINHIHQSEYRGQFFVLEQSIGRRLKEKMLRRRRLSDKTATEILKYQLSYLKSRLFQRYESLLQARNVSETQIVNAIQTIIEDLIYEKYGYEQEHMIIKLSDTGYSQKEEIRYLTEQIQFENEKLLGELAGFRTALQTIDYD